jgi:hypothetical protein
VCVNIQVTDIEIVCKCCGHLFIGHESRLYCTECRHLKYKIVRRHANNWQQKTMQKKFENVSASIQISDKTFISDCGVPGMDCEHCPLPDCILEVDE